MKIVFLAHNIYGIGGTVRTVVNLAEALAARHEVEIASVYRRLDEPMFDISPRVRLVPLLDMRPDPDGADRTNALHQERSRLVPPSEEFFRQYSALSDERVVEYLKQTDADVVIGTRPSLNLLVAEYAPDKAVRLAQEHMTHSAIPAGTRAAMARLYPRIDAAVTVTDADAETFRATTPVPGLHLLSIPNSVPAPALAPADSSSRTVVAAGRLDPVKRYDLLVHAFARVLDQAPDWKLRIYGTGREYANLKGLVQQLGLYEHITLMGNASPLEAEWVKGSIAAITSDRESFGMTVVEAMRCGLPVVSTACPDGPPEIIRHGEDGLLVPVGDVDGITAGLMELIRDEEKRARMGSAALENSRRYDPDVVARRYEALIDEVCDRRGLPRPAARAAGSGTLPRSTGVVTAAAARAAAEQALPARSGIRRLLGRWVRGEGSAESAARATTAPRRPAGQPTGNCVADSAGQIVVRVDWPGLPEGQATLVCRSRSDRTVRVDTPLQATSGAVVPVGALGARLPVGSDALSEGRWDMFVEFGGRLHRLRAGVRDLRELVDAGGRPATLPLRSHVPYATQDGFLALRSWVRRRHAECTAIRLEDEGIVLEGRLVGEEFDSEPVLTVRRRRQEPLREELIKGSRTGEGGFRFRVPVELLVEARIGRHEDWDFWVGDGSGAEVRLARLLSDMAELKSVYSYPHLMWRDPVDPELAHETPEGVVRVRPYCSSANEIAVSVVENY